MAESAPAPSTSVKTSKRKSAVKRDKSRPRLSELILKVVSESKGRTGVSFYALKKGLEAKGYNVESNKYRIKRTVRNLVENGSLVQTRGIGASGSFKIAKQAAVKKSKPRKQAPKLKKTGAKKGKKETPKKKKKVTSKTTPRKRSTSAKKQKPKKTTKPKKAKKTVNPTAKTPKRPRPAKKGTKKKNTPRKVASKKK